MTSGVLPAQALRQLIAQGALSATPAIRDDQIQPASLDLRLGPVAYRVRASFLAGNGRRVQDRLEHHRFRRWTQGLLVITGLNMGRLALV